MKHSKDVRHFRFRWHNYPPLLRAGFFDVSVELWRDSDTEFARMDLQPSESQIAVNGET